MNDTFQNNRLATAVLGSLLALGLIVGGWLLGSQIKATRLSDRYVTVKGLVERRVKSDLAIWPIIYKEPGDDLSLVYAKTEADRKTVLEFLADDSIAFAFTSQQEPLTAWPHSNAPKPRQFAFPPSEKSRCLHSASPCWSLLPP